MVKIRNFTEYINKIIIPKGTFIPIEKTIYLKFIVSSENMKIVFLEGEGILPLENKVIKEIELKSLFENENFEENSKKSKLIDICLFLDQNYILQIDITYKQRKLSKKHKYIPVKTLNRKNSFSLFKSNQDLMKLKLRAKIAEKIFTFESYYGNLHSRKLKKKFRSISNQIDRFKCYS